MAARRVTTRGALVLDCEGLARYAAQDRDVMAKVYSARRRGARVVVSGVTVLEARGADMKRARWEFVLSQLEVLPMTVAWFKEASALLADTGLHGHKYAIDAMVAVTALHQETPVVMLTSDVDDMTKLCGEQVTYVAL